MTNHAKAARRLLDDTVIHSISEPGHPHHSSDCDDWDSSGKGMHQHHDYSFMLAALTHAVLAVADAINNKEDQ